MLRLFSLEGVLRSLALNIIINVYLYNNKYTCSAFLSILATINAPMNPMAQIPTETKRGAPKLYVF